MTFEARQNPESCSITALNQRDFEELKSELSFLQQTCTRQQVQLQEMQVQLQEVLNSTWWRIGEPLRLAGRRYPNLARTFRYLAWSTGKFLYYSKKGVFLQRWADYRRRKAMQAKAKQMDLVKALGLPPQKKIDRDPSSIKIIASPSPVVSIIIPAYGHVHFTLRCLASIADAPPKAPIEILVIEDASGDPEVTLYDQVSSIRLIKREQNLGFLRSSNDAIKQANGEFIFLLNNDTEVMPGAIDALLCLLRSRHDVGLVGARLLYPDGTQQEAGGIIWQDGSVWNYGRRDDPRRPEYCYVREVDYISGAAIMLPRSVWNRLGGFDEHFLPAYCEDTDLAIRVRQAGLKVLYQPKAWIIHHEGVSHGTHMATGVKSYQIQNGHKLAARWRDILTQEQFEYGKNVMRARDRAQKKRVVLVIDHYVPEPDRDAGSRTMFQFMETLLATGRVVKFWPANRYETPIYTEALQDLGIEVLYGPWVSDFETWIKAHGKEIDEILLSRPMFAPMFLPALRKYSKAPIVFYGHDLHFMRMEKEAETTKDASKLSAAQEMKELERRVWLSVDHVLYPSHDEVEKVFQLEPTVRVSPVPICAFSNCSTLRTTVPQNSSLIFVAGYRHSPNIDAAIWFCRDVLPHIRTLHPEITVALIGSNPPGNIKSLADDNVVVTGGISDEELDNYYATSRVAIIPLRFGAGVKMKAVEALHKGIPIVTTYVGAQGLEGLENVVDVTDDPLKFAEAIIKLLEDDAWWLQRSADQTNYAFDRFSITAMSKSLEAAFTVPTSSHKTAA